MISIFIAKTKVLLILKSFFRFFF